MMPAEQVVAAGAQGIAAEREADAMRMGIAVNALERLPEEVRTQKRVSSGSILWPQELFETELPTNADDLQEQWPKISVELYGDGAVMLRVSDLLAFPS